MPLTMDHAVIAVRDLNAAMRDYRALGFTVTPGGVHASRATHNALITFADGTYLELMAPTGELPVPGVIDFSVLLRRGEGLVGFALQSGDLEGDRVRLLNEGFAISPLIPGERRRPDGKVIRWTMALTDEGYAPLLIQDLTPRDWRVPGAQPHANGARGLRAVEIAACDIATVGQRYLKLFGAADRSTPAVDSVRLHPASTEADCPELLYAIHLDWEPRELPLEQTHGVRFA